MVRHYKPVDREHLPKTRVSSTKASECARLIEQGLSDLVVSKQTGVSNRQVHRYRLNLQKWGNVHVPSNLRTSGPPRAMNEDMVNKMLEYLRDRPGAQLEELAKYLQQVYGKSFSTSQLSNRLKEKGWTRTIVERGVARRFPIDPNTPPRPKEGKSPGRQPRPTSLMPSPPVSVPFTAQYDSTSITIGAGVAIFHVATARVVLCYHTHENYWFLPKGRRDVHESAEQCAEREGYEESGFRNRLIPLPFHHRQTRSYAALDPRLDTLSTEPVWTQLMPITPTSQYLLHWYIAETLPPALESELDLREQEARARAPPGSGPSAAYQYPPRFPLGLSMGERMSLEKSKYVPKRHEGTSADPEEAVYTSELMDVEKAVDLLAKQESEQGSVMADVVARGWDAIRQRLVDENIEGAA